MFLRRLNHLKDKIDKDLEYLRISRSKVHDAAPKGGKRILEEERDRRLVSDPSIQYNSSSAALMNAI